MQEVDSTLKRCGMLRRGSWASTISGIYARSMLASRLTILGGGLTVPVSMSCRAGGGSARETSRDARRRGSATRQKVRRCTCSISAGRHFSTIKYDI